MSYITKQLLPNETLIYSTQRHWIGFVPPIVVGCISLLFCSLFHDLALLGYLGIIVALCQGIVAAIAYLSSEFAVTDKRVLIKLGFIRIDAIETLLNRVESVQVHQSILGRILGYGTIVISGTGGTKDYFHEIAAPLTFRRYISEQLAR